MSNTEESNPIDFSQGGYGGDIIEETFKYVTASKMPFWWQFREVLRASHEASTKWSHADNSPLTDDEQRELIALSLINYHVYTGIAEAIAFFEQMHFDLTRTTLARIFDVRRHWKAMYSSFYSSFNALSNIVYVVIAQKSAFGDNPNEVWNYTPTKAIKLVQGRGYNEVAASLVRIQKRLEIRDHLDHYWTIWHRIEQGIFLIDSNFTKGYISVNPSTEVRTEIDAVALAQDLILDSLDDYNIVYRELAIKGGHLDKYLSALSWKIDYSDYGPPHNGERPLP